MRCLLLLAGFGEDRQIALEEGRVEGNSPGDNVVNAGDIVIDGTGAGANAGFGNGEAVRGGKSRGLGESGGRGGSVWMRTRTGSIRKGFTSRAQSDLSTLQSKLYDSSLQLQQRTESAVGESNEGGNARRLRTQSTKLYDAENQT